MSESIFCDICEKVLSQQKGEYDHGCLDCHGQPYADKIFWLRKDAKAKDQRINQLESALRDMGEALHCYERHVRHHTEHPDEKPAVTLKYAIKAKKEADGFIIKHKEILDTINNQLNDTK